MATVAAAGAVVTAAVAATVAASRSKAGAEARLPPHPGTADGRRARAWNPQIPPEDFEARFVATAAKLSSQAWDFVVVGAGSAGCVLASRLSQDPTVRVLLLEAGGEAHNAAKVRDPRKAPALLGSEAEWGFRSTPQPQLLPPGRALHLERGKTLGGSSALNYVMWVWGGREDYDRWATECGCGEEWSYEGVLPHFQSLERMLPGAEGGATTGAELPGRGKDGGVVPTTLWPPLPENEAFKASAELMGFKANPDYNGAGGQGGYSDVQMSVTQASTRADAFTAFVEPALRTRPNLCVASEAYTRRVLFEGTRCVGVEVQLNDGSLSQVRAQKEVILSAGAIQTPQLLLLSGVGGAEQLKRHNIPVVADVPAVGRHLQDHSAFFMAWQVPEAMAKDIASPPAGTMGLNAMAFFKTSVDEARDKAAGRPSGYDIQSIFASRIDHNLGVKILLGALERNFGVGAISGDRPRFSALAHGLARRLAGMQSTRDMLAKSLYMICVNNHPVSRGSVTLRSANPLDPPDVDVGWFRDPSDLEAALEAMKKLREMMKQQPFAKYLGEMPGLPGIHKGLFGKGFDAFFKASDQDLREFILLTGGTTWHYSCTARMGPPDAPLTDVVLDPRLRVRGVSGLRVADISVAPFVTSGNTNAPAMMIGDKAAKLILQDHGLGRFRAPQSAL